MYICIYIFLTKDFFVAGMTQKNSFKIKIKVLNLKRAKTVVLKTWEYNTSYIPVHVIVP